MNELTGIHFVSGETLNNTIVKRSLKSTFVPGAGSSPRCASLATRIK